MNLSSRDLRAVIALADEKNFTRAAERCHLSQSAFSTLIRTIEESLGAKLFCRTTRNVELTAEGKLFEPSARRTLADLDAMVDDFRDLATRRKGRVSIALLPSLAAGWLPDLLARFSREYPGIDLEVFDLLSDQCLALLRGGRVDFAVASASPGDADLSTEILCADRFFVVCTKDHPLARLAQVKVKELCAYPFVHLARTSSVRQHLEAAFHPMQMRSVMEVEHLATVTGMVEAGLGISVVPAFTLFSFERAQLVFKPLALPGLARRTYLVKRRGRELSIAAQALYDLMRQHKPREPSTAPALPARRRRH